MDNDNLLEEELIKQTLFENVGLFIEHYENEVVMMLKHIMDNKIEEERFVFEEELTRIKGVNNIKKFGKKVSSAIGDHYSQNSIVSRIKYHFKRDKIINSFLYKVLANVERDLSCKAK